MHYSIFLVFPHCECKLLEASTYFSLFLSVLYKLNNCLSNGHEHEGTQGRGQEGKEKWPTEPPPL